MAFRRDVWLRSKACHEKPNEKVLMMLNMFIGTEILRRRIYCRNSSEEPLLHTTVLVLHITDSSGFDILSPTLSDHINEYA
jgi:hypothetical protein